MGRSQTLRLFFIRGKGLFPLIATFRSLGTAIAQSFTEVKDVVGGRDYGQQGAKVVFAVRYWFFPWLMECQGMFA